MHSNRRRTYVPSRRVSPVGFSRFIISPSTCTYSTGTVCTRRTANTEYKRRKIARKRVPYNKQQPTTQCRGYLKTTMMGHLHGRLSSNKTNGETVCQATKQTEKQCWSQAVELINGSVSLFRFLRNGFRFLFLDTPLPHSHSQHSHNSTFVIGYRIKKLL